MLGAIRKRDLLAHPLVTLRCFGGRVFLRGLLAGPQRSFESVLVDAGKFHRHSPCPEALERCVRLELLARRMYETLARRFFRADGLRDLFALLARRRGEHAELLRLCRGLAGPDGWDAA